MKWATRLHLLTLLTWRAMRQNRSQSILGIALITLPVAVATFAQVTYSTAIPTDQEEKVAAMGMAQARVSAGSRQLAAADLKDVLPDGARILEASTTVVDLETGIGAVPVSVSLVDLSDATTRGMFDVTAGRIPTSSGQVVVSEHLADIRNVDINSRIRLSNGHMAIVTGKIRDPTDYGRDFLLGLPDDPEFNDGRGPFGPWLVSGLPSGYDEPELSRALAPHGFKVDPRSLGRTPGPRAPAQESSSDDDRAILLFAALGLGEVSLLSAAVFTLSAQRRRRELGMLASAGGRPSDVRATVVAEGLLIATFGATIGILIGCGVALAAQPAGEALVARSWGSPVIRADQLALIGVLAILAGTVAASIPARSVARNGPLGKLHIAELGSPRSGLRRVRIGAWPTTAAIGLAGIALAVSNGWILLAVILSVVYMLGLLGSCDLLLRLLALLASRMSPRARIAFRGLLRVRSRSLPLSVAVCAVATAASVAGIFIHSANYENSRTYVPGLRPGQAILDGSLFNDDAPVDAVTRAIGNAEAVPISYVTAAEGPSATRLVLDNPALRCTDPKRRQSVGHCPPSLPPGILPAEPIAVADDRLVAAMFPQHGDRLHAKRALVDGAVVVVDPALQDRPNVASLREPFTEPGHDAVELQAEVVTSAKPASRLPHALVAATTLRQSGLSNTSTEQILLMSKVPPSDAQVQAAHSAVARYLGGEADLYVERGYDGHELDWVLRLFMILATLTVLGTTALAGALSVGENARDDRIMVAAGAPPRFIRSLATARLLALTVPAAILGFAGGGSAIIVGLSAWGAWQPSVPWFPLGAILVATALAAWLVGQCTPRIDPGAASCGG